MSDETLPDCAICEGPLWRVDGEIRHVMEHALNQHTPEPKADEAPVIGEGDHGLEQDWSA